MAAGRLLFLAVLASLVGCVRAGPNLNKLAAVKSAAIISYSGEVEVVDAYAQNGNTFTAMASAVQGMSDVASTETEARRLQEAQQTYDALVEKLGKGMGWTVASREAVTGNAVMQALYKEKMGERRPNAGLRFGVPSVPWWEFGNSLSTAELQKLKTALGVDVLVVAKLRVQTGRSYGVSANGVGVMDLYPKAILTFAAYDGGEDGAIWTERWMEGPNAQQSVRSSLGVVDTTDEAKCVLEAAQLVVDTLVQKYQQTRAAAPAQAAVSN